MLKRHLIFPSQLSNRVSKVRYNDTMKIWDSFIHMMTNMDVPGAVRGVHAGENAVIIASIKTGCGASGRPRNSGEITASRNRLRCD